MADRNKPSLQP